MFINVTVNPRPFWAKRSFQHRKLEMVTITKTEVIDKTADGHGQMGRSIKRQI